MLPNKTLNNKKNPIKIVSSFFILSIIYTTTSMILSKGFMLDGRGDELQLDLPLHLFLVCICILLIFFHSKLFGGALNNEIREKNIGFRIYSLVSLLVLSNWLLWILFDYGEFNVNVAPGAFFISLFNLQYVMPIYAAVMPLKKWSVLLAVTGVALTLLRGSSAVLFLTLIVLFYRVWIKMTVTPQKIILYFALAVAVAFVSNEIKTVTRGMLTDLNFADYGIARINQISNLIYIAQNIDKFNVYENSLFPQIVYEMLAYFVPNSILGYNPELDYEFQFTEIVTNFSGIVSFSTTTWIGKLYIYIKLGLYGSAAIFLIIPLLFGCIVRKLIRRYSEYRLVPVLYSMELMFLISGNFTFYTKYLFVLVAFIVILNYRPVLNLFNPSKRYSQ